MNYKTTKARLWTKDFILIIMASTGTAICNFFFFTALPLYAEKISGSSLFSGMMLTFYSIAALSVRPVAGILSDRFGRIRQLVIGGLICAVACALYGLTTAVVLLLAIRVLNGIGFGMFSTSSGAVAADVIPKERLAEGIGYFGLNATFASAFAPFIALTIVGDGEIGNFKTLFFLASGLCFGSIICSSLISYERKSKKSKNEISTANIPDQHVKPMDDEPLPKTFLGFEYAVFMPTLVMILVNFASSSINTFLTLFALDRSMGNIGLYFTFSAVGLLLSRILFGKLIDRRGPDMVVIPGIITLVVCFMVIPFINTTGLLFALAIPMGLAKGVVSPSINALMFRRCSPKRRGSASAAFYASMDIGFALGGLFFGLMTSMSGYGNIYYFAAGLAVLALILYVKTVAEKKHVKPKPI